jgi:hypothetical protein
MKLYQITSTMHGVTATRFVGTQAEAASRRATLVSAGAHRADITTTPVEVPTDKVGLLAFLNTQTGA